MASREVAAALLTELAQAESVGGMAVPDELGVLLRSMFGVEPTGIHIHENPLPEALGAAALTHGAHIHLAPSACRPTTPDGLALLAHELAHVVQQRTGRARRSTGEGPMLLDDALLEAEADALAAFVRSGTPFCPASLAARPSLVTPGPTGVLQPKITVDHQGAPRIYAHTNTPLRKYRYYSVDALWVELVKTQVYKRAQGRVDQLALKEVLRRWCDAPRSPSQVNIVSGYWSESQDKTFSNYEDVASAALGEVLSRDNRQKETRLAQDTYASNYLKGQVQAFIREVLAWHGNQPLPYQRRLDESGRYWWYYRPFLAGQTKALHSQSIISALRYATTHQSPVSEMVSALSDYSLQSRHIYGGQKDTFFRKTDAELKEINKARATHYTIKESASWSLQARSSQVPTGAGPSATTMNVMALVEAVASARAINAETAAVYKEALAWGLFAFWNQTADRLRGEIHTFHEVMTVAARWGVPYAPLAYPDSVPTAAKSTVKRHLELNMAKLRRQLAADDEDDDD